MRRKRPLDRTTRVVRDASLIVIASEDKYAVRQYFDFFRSTKIQFKVLETEDGKSAPEHVLDRLDDYMKEFDIGEGDEFWLVSDCDHWIDRGHIKNLLRAMQECRQKGIQVAVSNPCLELWLLLHFVDFPPDHTLSCAEIVKRIRNAVGSYDKTRVFNLPIDDERVKSAVKRSAGNTPPSSDIPDRPYTVVHRIIEHLLDRHIISVHR
ncbi:MAG TPA: RloB family protein [Gemmataceae bacterium]|nr:RloB family protein [Gemmataceae bacterium]